MELQLPICFTLCSEDCGNLSIVLCGGDLVPSPEPAGASPGMVPALANELSARGSLQQEYPGQVWVWISVNQRPC